MKKIDVHLHVTLEETTRMFNHVRFSGAAEMKHHLEELGIEKAIIMSLAEQEDSLTTNEIAYEISRRFPETYCWYCNLPIECKNPAAFLAKQKERGAKGLGEWVTHLPLDDGFMKEILGACEALGLPVLFHMSADVPGGYGVIDELGLYRLEAVLEAFPRLTFIGHSQPFWYEISGDAKGTERDRYGYPEGKVKPGGRLPYLLDHYPNLYCDLSANSGGNAVMRDPDFGLRFLETYQDRLFFGTDMANTDMVFPLGACLDAWYESGALSKAAYEKIIRKNALEKLLKPERKDDEKD